MIFQYVIPFGTQKGGIVYEQSRSYLAFFRALPASTWGHYSQTPILLLFGDILNRRKMPVFMRAKDHVSAFGGEKPYKIRGNAFLPNRTVFALPQGGICHTLQGKNMKSQPLKGLLILWPHVRLLPTTCSAGPPSSLPQAWPCADLPMSYRLGNGKWGGIDRAILREIILSSDGAERNSLPPMTVPDPSPVLDKNHPPMSP